MLIGISVIGVFGWKRISREIEKQRMLKECVVFEIWIHGLILSANAEMLRKFIRSLMSSRGRSPMTRCSVLWICTSVVFGIRNGRLGKSESMIPMTRLLSFHRKRLMP